MVRSAVALNASELSQEQGNLFPTQGTRSRPRPLLKWAGGKTRLLSTLRRCIPTTFNRYFEPFLGGGALFFDLCPDQPVLGDSNFELIHCYSVVRDHPEDLIRHLGKLKVSEKNFYSIRATHPETLSSVARAARLIYLNKTCYNGLYRVNKKGLFNAPFGHYKTVSLANPDNIRRASRLLKSATLLCDDYKSVLRLARKGDFLYLDPPYLPVGKYSDFKRYTKDFFYESDHQELADCFRRLAGIGCYVLLSNSYHETITSHYEGYRQAIVEVPRYVNCKGNGRGKVKELIIANYPLRIPD